MSFNHEHSYVRNDVPFVQVDDAGRIVGVTSYKEGFDLSGYLQSLSTGTISVGPSEIATHADDTLEGNLSGAENYDLIPVQLTAGQTYSFSYRGTAEGGIEDPYLALFGPGFVYVTEDDDGGYGRTSQITYTPTTTGTHYLYATSWYTLAGYGPAADTGNYTVDVWEQDAAHDAGETIEDAVAIDVGTTFAYLDSATDLDMYALEVTEGLVYSFVYAGGISDGGDWDDEAGENIGVLRLYDSAGNPLGSAVNYETGITYFAEQSGTVYVRAESYAETTGGYTLDVEEVDPSTRDPLESLNWDSAANIPTVMVDGVPTAYVYFAPEGENFGELADDDETPMTTYGWEQHQIDAVMHGLQNQYTPITGINYEITTDVDQATFRLMTTESALYGAYFYPQAPNYGDAAGIGVFNLLSGGFGFLPESLEPGGFSYAVILHEFGHAHGIAHPHDTGGGSEVMLGVTGPSGSLGVYDLNQGVYTVMSYNDAWQTHPDGATEDGQSVYTVIGHGWSETLGAMDIAVLQARYGTHDHNEGDDVYVLNDDYTEASYMTIWDSGGNDTISYSGELDAQIDLTAATLDYTPTGGGVVSFLYNDPQPDHTTEVKGGYTIANGVVIENATGGKGDDILIGNDSANVLTGNNGNDHLLGRDGNDTLRGGNGDDILNGGAGDDVLVGGRGANTFVFTDAGTDTILDFHRSDRIDLSGLDVSSDDVQIFNNRVEVELGAEDLIIMMNTQGFTDRQIIFAEESASTSSSTSSSTSTTAADLMFAPAMASVDNGIFHTDYLIA